MPQFVLLCRDKPDSLDLRMETRPAHLEYFQSFGNKLLLGGPMLDGKGDPIGSMMVIEAADEGEARAIADEDRRRRRARVRDGAKERSSVRGASLREISCNNASLTGNSLRAARWCEPATSRRTTRSRRTSSIG